MVLLYQPSYRCSYVDLYGFGVASGESASRACSHYNAYQASRSARYLFLRSGNCVPPVGAPMGRFNVCMEQWPHHRSVRPLWSSNDGLRFRSNSHAGDRDHPC